MQNYRQSEFWNFARIWCITNRTPGRQVTHLSCKRDQIKWVIIWTGGLTHLSGLPHLPGGPPPPCKQALRSNDADRNEKVTKTIGLISKTLTSHVHHAFLYISFPFLPDYDVKMPNFAFMEEINKQQRNFISLSELGSMVIWNSASGGFVYIWWSKWVRIIAIKTEKTQIHFLSDVLVAVVSLNLEVPNIRWRPRYETALQVERTLSIPDLVSSLFLPSPTVCGLYQNYSSREFHWLSEVTFVK